MTTRQEWLALAKRCEEAKGPDREIDVEIEGSVMGWSVSDIAYCCLNDRAHSAPNCTGSIDAITALIERELDVAWLRQDAWNGSPAKCSVLLNPTPNEPIGASAATPALALCAAFCLAKAALAEQPKDSPND